MRAKNWMLGGLLATVAILGPMVAYAGVSVIYPSSSHTANVATPPITFAQGADYTVANNLGFLSAFATDSNGASFSLTLGGLAGGQVTIDKYATITKDADITSFKVEIASAISGDLTSAEITTLKLRLWTGATAPTADGDSQVCGVLDLESGTESTGGPCTGTTVHMQVIYALAAAAAGTSTLSIRPSSLVF